VVKMQKPINFDLIWLEDRDKEEVIPAVLCEFCEPGVFEFGVTDGSPVAVLVCPYLSDYCSRWRAWSQKPTDEERKAAEWKD
jgi:hypothetical protein